MAWFVPIYILLYFYKVSSVQYFIWYINMYSVLTYNLVPYIHNLHTYYVHVPSFWIDFRSSSNSICLFLIFRLSRFRLALDLQLYPLVLPPFCKLLSFSFCGLALRGLISIWNVFFSGWPYLLYHSGQLLLLTESRRVNFVRCIYVSIEYDRP